MSRLKAVRGMRDILPDVVKVWTRIDDVAKDCLGRFGYHEIRLPIIEFTALFERGVGGATDIVEKEMFSLESREGDSLTLRPEGTAGCVRAALQNGLAFNTVSRLWYRGPMFRHERPQKGRYRQFEQIGAEVFGIASAALDAELIDINRQIFQGLGVSEYTRLRVNTIGSPEERKAYAQSLKTYLDGHREALDDDSVRRLERNPLRILDSKHPVTREVVAGAPKIDSCLGKDSRCHFERVLALLEALNIDFETDPYLVRGLDYYTHTVFEFETDRLGAQGAVSAGGRYDGLVETLGGRPTPGAGFAIGVDRLALLVNEAQQRAPAARTDILYGVSTDQAALGHVMRIANRLRGDIPGLSVVVDTQGGRMANQMRRADREGASWALIAGESEIAAGVWSLKPMREVGEQQRLTYDALVDRLSKDHGGIS